jgi:hypothetical protein
MLVTIFIMGGANAARIQQGIDRYREDGVDGRERRIIANLQRTIRALPTMIQLQFRTRQHPTPQYSLQCSWPSTCECNFTLNVKTEFDATMLAYCRARLSFEPDPEGRSLYRLVKLEIPERGVNCGELVSFDGVALPRGNSDVEGWLSRYGE